MFGKLIDKLSMWCGMTTDECVELVARMNALNVDGETLRFRIPAADVISPPTSKNGTWMTDACKCPGGRVCIRRFTLLEIADASIGAKLGELTISEHCSTCHTRLGTIADLLREVYLAHTKFAVPECDLATPKERELVAGAFRTLVDALSGAPVAAPATALLDCADLIALRMAKNPFAPIGK